MKNNRKNRKRVKIYFDNLNARHGLTGDIRISPVLLYRNKNKIFYALIGSEDNPKSEILRTAIRQPQPDKKYRYITKRKRHNQG
jgi:hypothetical protein